VRGSPCSTASMSAPGAPGTSTRRARAGHDRAPHDARAAQHAAVAVGLHREHRVDERARRDCAEELACAARPAAQDRVGDGHAAAAGKRRVHPLVDLRVPAARLVPEHVRPDQPDPRMPGGDGLRREAASRHPHRSRADDAAAEEADACPGHLLRPGHPAAGDGEPRNPGGRAVEHLACARGGPGARRRERQQRDPRTDAVRSHSCGISHAGGGPQGATIERWGRGNPGHRTCVRRFAAGGSGSWSRRPAARRW
jgi:hypothetical protein